jgi:hypothetical protein
MDVPYNDEDGDLQNANWDEKILRTYLFWTPHKWFSLSAEYLYEDLHRDEDFADGANDVETHYLPLGVNFFHPCGLSASFKGTFVDQDGEFERATDVGVFEDGDDNFWVFDAAINYRLPKRYGFISVGAKNIFDEDFEHFDTDPDNARIQPDRTAFATVTLAFP